MMIKTGEKILEDILSESGADFKPLDTRQGPKFVIDTLEKLDDLINGLGPGRKRANRGMVVLKLAKLSRQKNLEWEEKLNRTYFSCGCVQGKTGICIAMVFGAGFWLFRSQEFSMTGIGLFALWILAGGTLGKWAGLLTDRVLFKKYSAGLVESHS